MVVSGPPSPASPAPVAAVTVLAIVASTAVIIPAMFLTIFVPVVIKVITVVVVARAPAPRRTPTASAAVPGAATGPAVVVVIAAIVLVAIDFPLSAADAIVNRAGRRWVMRKILEHPPWDLLAVEHSQAPRRQPTLGWLEATLLLQVDCCRCVVVDFFQMEEDRMAHPLCQCSGGLSTASRGASLGSFALLVKLSHILFGMVLGFAIHAQRSMERVLPDSTGWTTSVSICSSVQVRPMIRSAMSAA